MFLSLMIFFRIYIILISKLILGINVTNASVIGYFIEVTVLWLSFEIPFLLTCRYWMREGDYTYPKSCFDLLTRSLDEVRPYKSGVYKIEFKDKIVQTYCDLERYGGGWTLVTKASTSTDWTKETTLERNINSVDKDDYSIFKFVDELKHMDPAEVSLFEQFLN